MTDFEGLSHLVQPVLRNPHQINKFTLSSRKTDITIIFALKWFSLFNIKLCVH
jgi:hypothetical protein